MGVGPQGEAGVFVPQVLGKLLNGHSLREEHRGVEVALRLAAGRRGTADQGSATANGAQNHTQAASPRQAVTIA